jgi:hypothetical protein
MTRGAVPRVGLWLLHRLGSGYQSEALIGDLIEQCARGKSPWWVWREIFVAIFIAQARRWRFALARRRRPSMQVRLASVLWWGLTELAVVLGVILITDQSRWLPSIKDMIALVVMVSMVPLGLATIGLRSLMRLYRRRRGCTAAQHWAALFLVMTLGVGALTWAATVHNDRGRASRQHHDPGASDIRSGNRLRH